MSETDELAEAAAMRQLLGWAGAHPTRHFVVRKCGTCIETRWRVAVYQKAEGERMPGIPGHGYGSALSLAVDQAFKNFFNQEWPEWKRSQGFYAPTLLWPETADARPDPAQ